MKRDYDADDMKTGREPKGETAKSERMEKHGGKMPHAGHGMHPDHPMLHSDKFHKNEKY